MRIAIFTDFYFEKNPISETVRFLKKRYEKEGHKVYILTATPKKKVKGEEGVFTFSSAYVKQYPQLRLSLSPFLSAKKIVSGLDIDIIHNVGVASMALAAATCKKDLEIPAISTITDNLPETTAKASAGKLASFIEDTAKKYVKWLYHFYDEVVYPSAFIAKEMSGLVGNGTIIPLPIYKFEKKKGGRPRYIAYISSTEHEDKGRELTGRADSIKNKMGKEVKHFLIKEKGNGKENAYRFDERKGLYEQTYIFAEPKNSSAFPYYAWEYMRMGNVAIANEESPLAEFLKEVDRRLVYKDNASMLDAISYAKDNKKELAELLKSKVESEGERIAERYLQIYEKYI